SRGIPRDGDLDFWRSGILPRVRGSERTGPALEHVRGRVAALQVARREMLDSKPPAFDEISDGTTQVTPAYKPFRHGRETVLPPPDPRVGCLPVLHKQKASPGPQHAPHFRKRASRVGDAAEGPRHDDGVDTRVVERDRLGRPLE